jgi:hypothetical protein
MWMFCISRPGLCDVKSSLTRATFFGLDRFVERLPSFV